MKTGRAASLFIFGILTSFADDLAVVANVERQPLAAQAKRVLETLDYLGEPLPAQEAERLRAATSVQQIQAVFDRHCLIHVEINPEGRVKVQEGPAAPELLQNGWRTFLIKVENQAGITPVLAISSPNAGNLAGTDQPAVARKFLELQMFDKPPMRPRLSGLQVEYRILQIYSRDAGKREAKLRFDIGQGSQDLGFRSDIDILFTSRAATKVTLRVRDSDGAPTTAAFEVRD
ncbi:MAG: CehA/McbA family metallohydrolase, partial [Bryobacteraceae bacterium]